MDKLQVQVGLKIVLLSLGEEGSEVGDQSVCSSLVLVSQFRSLFYFLLSGQPYI